MRRAVLGSGEVGGFVGGAPARARRPVTLLVLLGRQHYYPEWPTVESRMVGTFKAPVRVTDRLDEPFDIIWIRRPLPFPPTALPEGLPYP